MCSIQNDECTHNRESFVEAEIYKDKFTKLLEGSNIFGIMVCNDLVLRINRISAHYQTYNSLRNEYSTRKSNLASPQLQDFLIVEEIIYHVRKAIDEMIYFLWMSKIGISNIDNQQHCPIDSIGKYLSQKKIVVNEFDEYMDFLNKVNILSNSYKHSINTSSPIANDLNCKSDNSYWESCAIKESDFDVILFQKDLLQTLKELFDKFLYSICNN